MSVSNRASVGLSARVIRLSAMLGVIIVVLVAVVASVSVSRLAIGSAEGENITVIQAVEDDIERRLLVASEGVDEAIAPSQVQRDPIPIRETLERLYGEHGNAFDRILLVDRAGKVEFTVPPSGQNRIDTAERIPFMRAFSGHGGYVSRAPTAEGGAWELWIARSVVMRHGEPRILLVKLTPGFIIRTVSDLAAAHDQRTIAIMEGNVVIAAAGPDADVRFSGAEWSELNRSYGSIEATTVTGVRVKGHYDDLRGVEGITWRTVVMRPRRADSLDTLSTVLPSLLALVLAGGVAIAIAWAVSRQVLSPLHDLERAARKAALGSYVRPVSVPRHEADEVGQLAEAFNAVSLRLNALHDLSQLLASASQLDQVLDGILAAMGHLVGPGSAAVYLLDDKRILHPARTKGPEFSRAQPVDTTKDGWLARALTLTDAIAFEQGGHDLETELPGMEPGHGEVFAAPLLVGQESLGVVVVTRDRERPLSEAEREMLRTFSAQAAVAVQTSRLFEEESRSRRIAEGLQSVAERLVHPESLEPALREVEGIVAELFSASAVYIALTEPRRLGLPAQGEVRDRLGAIAAQSWRRGGGDPLHELPVASGEFLNALLADASADRVVGIPMAPRTDHGAVMVIALGAESPEPDPETATAIADEIALALDNAYHYQRALTRATNLETIFRISQAVGSSLQIKVVLNRVLDVVQKILAADAVALFSYDPRRRHLTATMGRGVLPDDVFRLEAKPGEDLVGEVFSLGEPVAMRDLQPATLGFVGLAAEKGLRSLLAVPLLARGRSIGVLIVFSLASAGFSDEDMSVLQTFASQAALAIDTARLYGHEHEVASVLQQSILPDDLPEFVEIEAASVYAPAGEDSEIGGDYYDLIRAPDGAIWFAIGDVCGKGVHAATKTSMIKYVVRALIRARLGPSAILSEVNTMIAERDEPSDIVTLWLGRYDAEAASLTWANGGHPPAIIQHVDGSMDTLGVTGALLGAMADAPYSEETVEFRESERVVLFTDGVVEARRGSEFFGEERVARIVATTSVHSIASGILADVRAFVDGELRDDIAVLVISPRGQAASSAAKEVAKEGSGNA